MLPWLEDAGQAGVSTRVSGTAQSLTHSLTQGLPESVWENTCVGFLAFCTGSSAAFPHFTQAAFGIKFQNYSTGNSGKKGGIHSDTTIFLPVP